MQGYYLLHIEPRFDLLAILAGTATFFIYMLIRIAAIARIKEYEPDERWEFFLKNIYLMRLLTLVSFIVCVIIYFLLPGQVQVALFVPGIISLVYGIPVKIKSKSVRIRDVGITKIFLISFVWAYIGSVLPQINSGGIVFSVECICLFVADFLFIFAIALPFDINDLKIDVMNKVKTIPGIIGIKKTFILSFILLFISGVIHVYLQRNLHDDIPDYSLPIIISILITGSTIYLTTKKKDKFIYFGLLDGMILLQFILIFLFSI